MFESLVGSLATVPMVLAGVAPRDASSLDVAPPDVAPPRGVLEEPAILFAIAVFGFAVVMVVWIRRRRSAP